MADAYLPAAGVTKTAALDRTEVTNAARNERRRKWRAFLLVLPLLVFIFFAFVAPIATMLFRSVYNPTTAQLIPATLEALRDWEGDARPDDAVLTTFAVDLKRLANARTSGQLAEEINRVLAGTSSIVKSTARAMRRADDARWRRTARRY